MSWRQILISKPVQGQSKEVDKKITEEDNDFCHQAPFCHVRVEYSGRRPKKWKLDFATFPELQKVLSELESDIMMEEKMDEHELRPNKTELVCVAEARDDIVKELDDMKQCIVWVQTILNNIRTELQSTIAKTVATMLEEHLKKGSKEESDSDWIM